MPSLCASLQVACVASASVRAEQNWAEQKSEKWGENKKIEEARWGSMGKGCELYMWPDLTAGAH